MSQDSWNPTLYDKFKKERSQPLYDLIALLQPVTKSAIIDLGCGTGEHTAALHIKMDALSTLGIDSSAKMLDEAKKYSSKSLKFELQNIDTWEPREKYDIVFSNAALQWCDDHKRIFSTMTSALKAKGQLAIQMPMNFDYTTHLLAKKMSLEQKWKSLLGGEEYDKSALMLAPDVYASILFALGFKDPKVHVNVYGHVLASRDHVIEWVQGTTLTHFKSRLTKEDYEMFLIEYRERLFKELPDTKPFFFPFKRIFIYGQLN